VEERSIHLGERLSQATVADAAPMSRTSTVFWTARTRFCIIAPSPTPMTTM